MGKKRCKKCRTVIESYELTSNATDISSIPEQSKLRRVESSITIASNQGVTLPKPAKTPQNFSSESSSVVTVSYQQVTHTKRKQRGANPIKSKDKYNSQLCTCNNEQISDSNGVNNVLPLITDTVIECEGNGPPICKTNPVTGGYAVMSSNDLPGSGSDSCKRKPFSNANRYHDQQFKFSPCSVNEHPGILARLRNFLPRSTQSEDEKCNRSSNRRGARRVQKKDSHQKSNTIPRETPQDTCMGRIKNSTESSYDKIDFKAITGIPEKPPNDEPNGYHCKPFEHNCSVIKAERAPSAESKKGSTCCEVECNCEYTPIEPEPDRIDIYLFDHLNARYLRTTDRPPPIHMELFKERVDECATRVWGEFFGTLHLIFTFFSTFILQSFKFLLQCIYRALIVELIQLFSDYFFKPTLTVLFNAIIQPVLILLFNILVSFRDLCAPLARGVGYFIEQAAKLLASVRLMDIKCVSTIGHQFKEKPKITQEV